MYISHITVILLNLHVLGMCYIELSLIHVIMSWFLSFLPIYDSQNFMYVTMASNSYHVTSCFKSSLNMIELARSKAFESFLQQLSNSYSELLSLRAILRKFFAFGIKSKWHFIQVLPLQKMG